MKKTIIIGIILVLLSSFTFAIAPDPTYVEKKLDSDGEMLCPDNSVNVDSGMCLCDAGYHADNWEKQLKDSLDEKGTRCVAMNCHGTAHGEWNPNKGESGECKCSQNSQQGKYGHECIIGDKDCWAEYQTCRREITRKNEEDPSYAKKVSKLNSCLSNDCPNKYGFFSDIRKKYDRLEFTDEQGIVKVPIENPNYYYLCARHPDEPFCVCKNNCHEGQGIPNCDLEKDKCEYSGPIIVTKKEEVQESPVVTIQEIEGDVEIQRKGSEEYIPAKVGDKVYMGDFVSTGFESTCTLRFGDIAVMTVREMTQFGISQFYFQGNVAKTAVSLRVGQVFSSVKPKTGVRAKFEIETPTSVTSARGTVFTVSYDEDSKETTVITHEGSVEVKDKDSDDMVVVDAGKKTKVSPEGKPSTPDMMSDEDRLSDEDYAKLDLKSSPSKDLFGMLLDFIKGIIQSISHFLQRVNVSIDSQEELSENTVRKTTSQDKQDTKSQMEQGESDQASQETTGQQMDEKCNNYYSGVASTFELYTDCVDNDFTKAMKSGEPYYCKVNMDTTYVPLESSIYEFWVLGNLVKYKQTLTYPEGEVQEGTFILKPEGTYVDPSGTHFLVQGLDKSKDWVFIPASEDQPYYNVAGGIDSPSTVTCEKQSFGKEMFDTGSSSSSSSGTESSSDTTSPQQETLEQDTREKAGNMDVVWGLAHGRVDITKLYWDAEWELETPSSVELIFKDPFTQGKGSFTYQIYSDGNKIAEKEVVDIDTINLSSGIYTIKIFTMEGGDSWRCEWT